MEIFVFIVGIGVTIIMVLILLSGFMQDMNWYDNKAAFDVIKANREDAHTPAAPSKPVKQSVTPVKQLIKWMDYHV